MLRRRLALISLFLAAACAGKDGATGPMGPAGPTGPTGPAGVQGLPGPAGALTFYRTTAVIGSNGAASVTFPAAVGTDINKPPLMSCYTGSTTSNVWLAVAGSPSTTVTYCGLVFSGGVWNAVMSAGSPGWLAAFVVSY